MRVRGEKCVLDGGEGKKSPPLPFVDLPEDEALALIASGAAKAYFEAGEEVTEEVTPEPVVEPAVVQEPAIEPPAATEEPVVEEPVVDTVDRQATLIEHFELLSDEDFVKTGPRAGKPKVDVLKESTGFADLTAEEVDAAFALKDAGQG